MNYLRGLVLLRSEGFARQVKSIDSIAAKLIFVVMLGLIPMSTKVVQAGEPPIPKLKTETEAAFERYVKLTEARNEGELKRGTGLLWVDGLPPDQRTAAYAALKRSEVEMQKLEILDNGKPIACPGGMIHHWSGVVFIPGAKLEDVLGVLENYDKHSVYYAPDVERSKIESRNGDHFKVFLRFRWHKVITVVLNAEHEVQYLHDGPSKAHSRSSAVRIAEVENAGKSDEREKPPGDDGGILWRIDTVGRPVKPAGGVSFTRRVGSLNTDVPTEAEENVSQLLR